jgi:hypothetical protein
MPGGLNIEKLRKVAALMDSPSEGERSAAMERTRKMLADAGKGFRDLPELLGGRIGGKSAEPASAPQSSPFRDIFSGFDNWMEEKQPSRPFPGRTP